jgi:hypothetical protein
MWLCRCAFCALAFGVAGGVGLSHESWGHGTVPLPMADSPILLRAARIKFWSRDCISVGVQTQFGWSRSRFVMWLAAHSAHSECGLFSSGLPFPPGFPQRLTTPRSTAIRCSPRLIMHHVRTRSISQSLRCKYLGNWSKTINIRELTGKRDDILLGTPSREQDRIPLKTSTEQDDVLLKTSSREQDDILLKTTFTGDGNMSMVVDMAEKYPPLSTKLLVGIGLFLAMFLVGME